MTVIGPYPSTAPEHPTPWTYSAATGQVEDALGNHLFTVGRIALGNALVAIVNRAVGSESVAPRVRARIEESTGRSVELVDDCGPDELWGFRVGDVVTCERLGDVGRVYIDSIDDSDTFGLFALRGAEGVLTVAAPGEIRHAEPRPGDFVRVVECSGGCPDYSGVRGYLREYLEGQYMVDTGDLVLIARRVVPIASGD